MSGSARIGERLLSGGRPVYIVAEMSANHGGDFERAVRIIEEAKKAGADAVKVQTYTPDTITIRSDRPEFRIGGGTLWDGRTLYDLYNEAYTPWEWQPRLKEVARGLGMDFFSSPFDESAVEFLEKIDVPAYKIASFEIVDIPLIERASRTGKPVILSTGMAAEAEIREAVDAVRRCGGQGPVLLKCTSAYPSPAEEMNLMMIPHLSRTFGVPAGLSDHTLGIAAAAAAAALGACMIEKHFTLSRADGGPDAAFSLEPGEFKAMVDTVRTIEKALGRPMYGATPREAPNLVFRRSLFIVKDVKRGEAFGPENVRSIRPGNGLHTRHLPEVLGRRAARDVPAGTPFSWDLVEGAGRR